MAKIFYLMGKSATGKDHIYKELISDPSMDLKPLIIYTTRPMREGETDGEEYWFSDVEELEKFRREGRIIEERVYQTVYGPWYYFTADNGQLHPDRENYLGIGTLESYVKMRRYYGRQVMVPLYVETEDGLRLERALTRERKQPVPKYAELCRRFLSDSEDFSEEKIREAGIDSRFYNNGELQACIDAIREKIFSARR